MPLDEGPLGADDYPMLVSRALTAAMDGHTQMAVSDATGIDQGRLSRIMRNDRGESPSLQELMRIEEHLRLPHGYILALAGIVTVEGARRGVEAAAKIARTR